MKQQLYFNILLKIDSYFILDRNTEIIKILKLFMLKKRKLLNIYGEKGTGKTFLIYKIINLYKSYFKNSSIFYFDLKKYFYKSLDEFIVDLKIYFINYENTEKALFIIDNYERTYLYKEIYELCKNYNNYDFVFVSNKKLNLIKDSIKVKSIPLNYVMNLNNKFKIFKISENENAIDLFRNIYKKYRGNLKIIFKFLEIIAEKKEFELNNLEKYLEIYYSNSDYFFINQFFSFLNCFDEKFVFTLSFFLSSNPNYLDFFNIFHYDDFIKILNKFIYNNYSFEINKDKNIYKTKNNERNKICKDFILYKEKISLEDFTYKFYSDKLDYYENFELFLNYFQDSERILNLAFEKISYFLKIKDNEKVFKIVNSLEEEKINKRFLLRYYLVKGNIFYFNKSYVEALEFFKKILKKRMGDNYLRETILLKIGFIKNYLGDNNEALDIIKNIIINKKLGGEYLNYAFLTIGEIYFAQNLYKKAVIFFLFIYQEILKEYSININFLNFNKKDNFDFNKNQFRDFTVFEFDQQFEKIIDLNNLEKEINTYNVYEYFKNNISSILSKEDNIDFFIKLCKNIAICFLYLNNFELSKYFFNLSLIFCEKNELQKAILYNDLGVLYKKFGINRKAYYYYLKAYDIFLKLNSEPRIAMVTNNLASLLMGYNRFDKSLKYLDISFEIKKKYNDLRQISVAYINYGIIYFHLNKIKISKDFLDKSYVGFLSVKDFNNLFLAHCYKILIFLFHDYKEIKNLNQYLQDNFIKNDLNSLIKEYLKSNGKFSIYLFFILYLICVNFNIIINFDIEKLAEINRDLLEGSSENNYSIFEITNIKENENLLEEKKNKINVKFEEEFEKLKDNELKNLIQDIIKKYKIKVN